MGSESESLKSQVATLIRRRGTGNGWWSRRMYRQEKSEIQNEPRADLTPHLTTPRCGISMPKSVRSCCLQNHPSVGASGLRLGNESRAIGSQRLRRTVEMGG